MHVALDATPLLGGRTGVGRYVEGVLGAVPAEPDAPRLTAVTVSLRRGAAGADLAPGTARRSLRVPARVWRRSLGRPSGLLDRALGRPDVWHATNFLAPVPRRAGLVVSVHDLAYLDEPGTVSPAAQHLDERVAQVLRHADAVATISRFSAERVQAAYPWLRVPVRVVPLGVDEGWFAARPLEPAERTALGLPADYVVAVGTREPRKNLGTLVRAHRLAGDRAPALVLVGASGWGDDLDGEVPGPGVLRLGRVPEHVLRGVVAGARALAAPARYEGFGLTVLEGLAAGVPVLASDIPPHREVAGTAATFLPHDSTEDWAEALCRLPDGPTARESETRGRRAREYSWQACARAHLSLWREAADRRAELGPRGQTAL